MKHTGALTGIMAVAAVALLLLARPWDGDAVVSNTVPTAPPAGTTRPSLAEPRPVLPARPDPAAPVETETVMGIPVRKDRRCTVIRHYIDQGNGMVTEAYSCVRNEPAARDDYDLLQDDVLEVLAYADPRAAGTLGKRLLAAEPDRSRALILRALALEPQNVEPALWLAAQAYSLRGDSRAARKATADSYVITRVARALGAPVAVAWIIDDLRESGFADAEIATLDSRVMDDLRTIRGIQQEVLGRSTIGEGQP